MGGPPLLSSPINSPKNFTISTPPSTICPFHLNLILLIKQLLIFFSQLSSISVCLQKCYSYSVAMTRVPDDFMCPCGGGFAWRYAGEWTAQDSLSLGHRITSSDSARIIEDFSYTPCDQIGRKIPPRIFTLVRLTNLPMRQKAAAGVWFPSPVYLERGTVGMHLVSFGMDVSHDSGEWSQLCRFFRAFPLHQRRC